MSNLAKSLLNSISVHCNKSLIWGALVLSLDGAGMLLVHNAAQAKPVKSSQERSQSFSLREFDFRATPAPSSNLPSPILAKYLVFVNQDSRLMLQVVQKIEPKAFIKQYDQRSVIQAGLFQDKDNAKDLEKKLASQGVAAQILKLDKSKFYFVVIPAKKQEFPAIKDQVTSMGISDRAVVRRKDKSYGSHVKIGPFAERGQAQQWQSRLVESGMNNARVYYGRD